MDDIGVYCIRNGVNTKIYIGSASVSITHRFAHHKHYLRIGKHGNKHLQSAWNKYGEEAFEFIIVENCDPNDCLILEQYWMDYYDVTNDKNGYNILPTAGSALGFRQSDETKEKLAIAGTGRRHTPEAKAKVSAAHKGRKHTEKSKENMSLAHEGKKLTPEHRAKIGASVAEACRKRKDG